MKLSSTVNHLLLLLVEMELQIQRNIFLNQAPETDGKQAQPFQHPLPITEWLYPPTSDRCTPLVMVVARTFTNFRAHVE